MLFFAKMSISKRTENLEKVLLLYKGPSFPKRLPCPSHTVFGYYSAIKTISPAPPLGKPRVWLLPVPCYAAHFVRDRSQEHRLHRTGTVTIEG